MSDTQGTSAATDVALLDTLSGPAREVAVTSMLNQSRQWLERAKESTPPAQDVAEFKAFVSTVAEAAKQKKLSEEIQMDALEMVRRSERALGVAIREGQDRGDLTDQFSHPGNGNQHVPARRPDGSSSSPEQFFSGGKERTETYAMTDGVTDEEFDAAIWEAKDEGNLSRANVVRKVREGVVLPFRNRGTSEENAAKWAHVRELADQGRTSGQIADAVGMSEEGLRAGARREGIDIRADRVIGKRRRINPLDVLEKTVLSLEVNVTALALVTYEGVTPEQADEWLERLVEPLRVVKKMQTTLREISNA